MPDTKMIGLSMAFGGTLGFWFAFSFTGELLSPWNFILAFIAAFAAFLIVYYFYKLFY